MDKEEGFILSNKHRKAVFQEIAAGASSAKTIGKKHHLHHTMVENAVRDLKEIGLITGSANELALTEHGIKVFADLKSADAL
jgi:hypothetical protein